MNYPVNECTGVAQENCADAQKQTESHEDLIETIRRLRYDLRKAWIRAAVAETNLCNIRNAVNSELR